MEINPNRIAGPNITKKIIKNNPSKLTSKSVIALLFYKTYIIPVHIPKPIIAYNTPNNITDFPNFFLSYDNNTPPINKSKIGTQIGDVIK
ncbi:MAG: hypothetical protein N4A35_06285 [Flavobacteriales bacterium]|nr:hypothetical protein [Flavobacteriales bacterium]